MTTRKCEVCHDHQYTDFIILPGESQAMCSWCAIRKFKELQERIKTLETEFYNYKMSNSEMTSLRCQSIHDSLQTRCVRRGGHALKHAYPNLWMKKMNPSFWHALHEPSCFLNVDELGDKLGFEFVDQDNPPPSSAEKED